MGYKDYTNKFKDVFRQHNIMAIVGNGFDIQALSTLKSPIDTRFESFYYYLEDKHFNPDNLLFRKMDNLRAQGKPDWSDVEAAIGHLREHDNASVEDIAKDLKDVQREFATFLDSVATPDILAALGELVVDIRLTIGSFTEFFGDISDSAEYAKLRLASRVNIGSLFNFQFINFNYTTLLDDYVYLDQEQYDPHPFQSSDRNISFHPNPRGFTDAQERQGFRMVSYLIADVVHPHGIQYTPRSLLFGVDPGMELPLKLTKPYWAQNDTKYGDFFAATDLFIIFGSSLGMTDGWWWRKIATSLRDSTSELIIYWRLAYHGTGITEQDIREKFATAASDGGNTNLSAVLTDKARVVLYTDTDERAWLSTSLPKPSWFNS